MQSNATQKIQRNANARRSFVEIAEHRARKGKMNKTKRLQRGTWE